MTFWSHNLQMYSTFYPAHLSLIYLPKKENSSSTCQTLGLRMGTNHILNQNLWQNGILCGLEKAGSGPSCLNQLQPRLVVHATSTLQQHIRNELEVFKCLPSPLPPPCHCSMMWKWAQEAKCLLSPIPVDTSYKVVRKTTKFMPVHGSCNPTKPSFFWGGGGGLCP